MGGTGLIGRREPSDPVVTYELSDGGSYAVYCAASDALPDPTASASNETAETRFREVSRRDQRSLRLQLVEYLVPRVPGDILVSIEGWAPLGVVGLGWSVSDVSKTKGVLSA